MGGKTQLSLGIEIPDRDRMRLDLKEVGTPITMHGRLCRFGSESRDYCGMDSIGRGSFRTSL